MRRRGERERPCLALEFAVFGDLPRLAGDFERDLAFTGLLPLAVAFGDLN